MMYKLPSDLIQILKSTKRRWLVTGGAGFIGSHLVECLLNTGQEVVTLDNLSTGHMDNLLEVEAIVGPEAWFRHRFIEGDITCFDTCLNACENIDIVLHQAALGSVPRSIQDPLSTHNANVTGFLNTLEAAKVNGVKRFIYAASSSTYGDSKALPKVENEIGKPLSPYAVTKYVNELYASVFNQCYGINTVGLRYFNVFGPRQDPNGVYAAVIPRWIKSLLNNQACTINGDGKTSRDFCFVANAVQLNLRASLTQNIDALNQVYNVACGAQTNLLELNKLIAQNLRKYCPELLLEPPIMKDFRNGDIRHSLADISRAKKQLQYGNIYSAQEGLDITITQMVNYCQKI